MLTARDIMNTNVIKVRENDTLKKLAELFLTHHISGAPVVDENGRLVGVVTESDLIFTTKKIHLPRTIAILDAFFFLDSPEKMEKEMKKIYLIVMLLLYTYLFFFFFLKNEIY